MPIYVRPSTFDLHVQMKFPKHILVQTRERNHELECIISIIEIYLVTR